MRKEEQAQPTEKQKFIELDEGSENEKLNQEEPTFSERWKNSKYSFVRGTYIVAHSIWTVVMAIGLFIAYLVALLAT
jgi:hypothetical protein